MAKNWAIAIGINQYNPNNFAPLRYARRDAELMRDFFQEVRFDEVYFFAENAIDIPLLSGASIPTYPSYGNLLSFLEDRFEHPFLSAGDNCWFFFAGHGMQYANRDYLMPIDANPRNVDRTAIPVSYVRERLSRCGADNVILMLDACRNEGSRDGAGVGRETQPGIITISACSPTERSWEIDELQQGAFTYALLEAFRLNGAGNCATVERLSQYLRHRVPEFCRWYGKAPSQTPNISVDPLEKYHYILLPHHATLADIATLKSDAYRLAFIENKPLLAKQICIRAIAAAMGRDMELLELFVRIQQLPNSSVDVPSQSFGGGRSPLDSPATKPTPQSPTPPADIPLESEKGINYTKLRDLLKAGNWKAADQETTDRMLQAIGKQDWWQVESKDLLHFPCKDLKTIDRLWMHYSKGHFGFSVQRKICIECGVKLDNTYPNKELWERFGNRVGWYKDEKWYTSDEHKLWYFHFTPSMNSVQGILPMGWVLRFEFHAFGLSLLLSHLDS